MLFVCDALKDDGIDRSECTTADAASLSWRMRCTTIAWGRGYPLDRDRTGIVRGSTIATGVRGKDDARIFQLDGTKSKRHSG